MHIVQTDLIELDRSVHWHLRTTFYCQNQNLTLTSLTSITPPDVSRSAVATATNSFSVSYMRKLQTEQISLNKSVRGQLSTSLYRQK